MPSHIPFGPEEPGSRKIFVLGGASEGTPAELCSVELFDATTETFTQVPTMPVNLGALSSAACAQGKLYVFGGSNARGDSSCMGFDPIAGTWEPVPPMPTPRVASTAVNLGGRIYVCGGYECGMSGDHSNMLRDMDTVEVFEPPSTWGAHRPLPSARSFCCSASRKLSVYVIGGYDSNGASAMTHCDRMSPRMDEWESMAPMSSPRRGASATVVRGNIFVCGGEYGRSEVRVGEMYDTTSNVEHLAVRSTHSPSEQFFSCEK